MRCEWSRGWGRGGGGGGRGDGGGKGEECLNANHLALMSATVNQIVEDTRQAHTPMPTAIWALITEDGCTSIALMRQ